MDESKRNRCWGLHSGPPELLRDSEQHVAAPPRCTHASEEKARPAGTRTHVCANRLCPGLAGGLPVVLRNSLSSGPQKTLMLRGARPPSEARTTPHSEAASIFSRGRGGGWGGSYTSLFIFVLSSVWVTVRGGGGWEEKGGRSLWLTVRWGPRLSWVGGREEWPGAQRHPRSACPAGPATVTDLTRETKVPGPNRTEEAVDWQ